MERYRDGVVCSPRSQKLSLRCIQDECPDQSRRGVYHVHNELCEPLVLVPVLHAQTRLRGMNQRWQSKYASKRREEVLTSWRAYNVVPLVLDQLSQ